MGVARSRLLDNWDYRVLFAPYHIRWMEGDLRPAFEQDGAVGILEQELQLAGQLEVWAQRAVLVSFGCEKIEVGGRPAAHEPAWVVILAGVKTGEGSPALAGIPVGSGAVLQALVHARTGEILLGRAVPVRLQRGA
jgi:hypothetical protein